ncbi:hypothetical protein ACJRO7_011345 [Eucalyptus globulus]|uniref:Uncharacterized protein n=1 Tax=Eucalyptus globulus TaxID=34317 RepID=A0ABD3LEU8_EUCGL
MTRMLESQKDPGGGVADGATGRRHGAGELVGEDGADEVGAADDEATDLTYIQGGDLVANVGGDGEAVPSSLTSMPRSSRRWETRASLSGAPIGMATT